MNLPKISVVVPVYNGAVFIRETLDSIISQQEINFEIIVIDDGSTDSGAQIISLVNDPRLNYHYQENQGVSVARNNGLQKVDGEFTVFFDADDIMPSGFLSSRAEALLKRSNVDFVCGYVKKFDANGFFSDRLRGPDGEKLEEQILLYDPEIVTCPSNFMFKTEFLERNDIRFNEKLSSTADRFFILECGKHGKSLCDEKIPPLHYRVAQNSMSHVLNKKLVNDNATFYHELSRANLIPENIRNKSLFLGDYILCGSYWKIGDKLLAIKYGLKCFFRNPFKMIGKFF